MDLPGYGRYAGEVHLMLRDAPLRPHQARIGQIAGAYTGVVDRLRVTRRVKFVGPADDPFDGPGQLQPLVEPQPSQT